MKSGKTLIFKWILPYRKSGGRDNSRISGGEGRSLKGKLWVNSGIRSLARALDRERSVASIPHPNYNLHFEIKIKESIPPLALTGQKLTKKHPAHRSRERASGKSTSFIRKSHLREQEVLARNDGRQITFIFRTGSKDKGPSRGRVSI